MKLDVESPKARHHIQCARCVMDTSARDITFDESGVCSYCSAYIALSRERFSENADDKQKKLSELVRKVKAAGRGKRYDCIVGVSGGVDSSWTLAEVIKLGLRPLATHMDNGWNSELAQNNIANLVRGLGVDLHTHVVDWEEYRALMQAFFDADVVDVELLYDNAMTAVNYRQASKYGVEYIMAGTNHATEGMAMPPGWNWFKFDKRQIVALAQRGRVVKMGTFPTFSTLNYAWYRYIRGIKWTSYLDYIEYNKFNAIDNLERDYNYKRYPYKHYESIFTRFYQGYILPRKFGIDKRRVHLSTLIMSGQIQREEALESLQGIPYPSEAELESDLEYFLKKMRWTRDKLDEYIARPGKPHDIYPTEKPLWATFARIYKQYRRSA